MPSVKQLSDMCIPLVNQPAYTKRKLRVVAIGAGFSGLLFAWKFQHEQPDLQDFVDLTIFEGNDGIGGTWKVNTYPGVQCDVPAHLYAFPFDPNPNWSKFYADGDEILEYVEGIADKWNLRRDIQFSSKVVGLEWQDDGCEWHVQVQTRDRGERVEKADIIVSAMGFLNSWKWPNIEGIHDFMGHKVHSAAWDHSFDYSGKRLGIIGNGSSAIQILPQLAKLPGTQIVNFQKGATWITQSLGEALGVNEGESEPPAQQERVGGNMEDVSPADEEVGSNFNPRYTQNDKRRFRDVGEHTKYRKMLQHGMNKGFALFRKESEHNRRATAATVERMRKALNYDEELCEKLIPKWELGCRRLTPGEGFLESFLLSNVSLSQSPILKITETGIQTEAGFHELDVIVCATGFDVSNIPHFPVKGQHGMTLAEKWADEPESYLSVACPEFPNYFIFTGPNATVGHGTLITSMNWTADYIMKWLRKMSSEDIKWVKPKQSATDEFVRYGDAIHETLTWRGGCSSWYKNHRKDGRVTATWPGSALLYREMIQQLRPEDWDIEYRSKNRFRFMGNGFTQLETIEGADLAFYLTR